MAQSESIAELAKALSAAQGEMGMAKKDSANPFFKSKYADLASVWEAARGPLAAHGLSVVQTNAVAHEGHVCVITTLLHASGEWIKGELELPVKEPTAQGHGSAITYARRYALAAICGIAADDDDGNAVSRRPEPMSGPTASSQTRKAAAKQAPPPAAATVSDLVHGLPEPVAPTPAPVHPAAEFEDKIRACKTPAELGALAIAINDAKLSKPEQARLRPIYIAKKKELDPPPPTDADGVVP